MKFDEVSMDGKCDVCGKEEKVAVFASSMGAVSFAYCEDCCKRGLEPYSAIISCFSTLSSEDAKDFYNKNEKIMNEFYHKTQTEFCDDVARTTEEFDNFCESMDQLRNDIDEEEYSLQCACGCDETEQYDEYKEDCYLVEYKLRCKKCGSFLGHWAYGNWIH